MSPTLRSFILKSPSASTTSVSSTPTSTPRKAPKCTKCGRPRAGHPRQGCPYVDSHDAYSVSTPEPITDALQSMHIDPSTPDDVEKRKRRRSSARMQAVLAAEQSLASLSTDSRRVVAGLLIPGIMDDDINDDEGDRCRQNILEWQAKLPSPAKLKSEATKVINLARPTMPGTFYTPSPSFFQMSQDSACKTEISQWDIKLESSPEFSPPPDEYTYLRPLVRSSSVEEREAFLIELSETSKLPPATVFVLPRSDITAIKRSAEKIGFHSRVVYPGNGGEDCWLILGGDRQAVQTLHEELETNKAARDQLRGKKGGTLKAAAGGAVVGAVATWTGLAFS